MNIVKAFAFATTIAGMAIASPAAAGIVTYSGADNSVSSLSQMTNSNVAAASFNAAVPGASVLTFESPLPSGVSIAGGTITSNSGCGAPCGFNTTSGGQNFLNLFGGTATFNFLTPIQAFGFFITGLQSDLVPQQTITFTDGSSQVLNTPFATNGGGAFFGFTDFGKSISSVSFNATNDIVSVDDVRFLSVSAVPEPATWAMMLLGFGAMGVSMRRRRRFARQMQPA